MITVVRRLWPVLVALIACSVVLYQFDWRNMLVLLPTLPVGWLLLVMASGTILVFATSAARWIAINQLSWEARTIKRVYCYVALAMAASLVTPFQLGELLKIRFAQESGLKLGNSAVNLALERIADLFTICALGVAGLIYIQTGFFSLAIATLFSITLFGIFTPLMLQGFIAWLGDTSFGSRLKSLAGPPLPLRNLVLVGVMTFLKWGLTLALWMLIIRLANVDISFWQGSFLLGAVAAISILSMIPGGIGVQEFSVRTMLVGMGIEPLHAETAAIVLRFLTPVMVLIAAAHLPLFYKKAQSTTA
ncbi:flippase-like domain-containing protein [Agrobacterium genomosp. 3 str. CIP 111-78]|uniref:Flippase-like domain-containing protein n=1 Tax=Agrobacterium tumefaciens TaxID=358 RepID=A0AAE6BUA8_AGRTU|nr:MULTISPECIES: lysylphosphatidylglycerol synthase transmembrane domain-containing protein [Agrobacterium tumefaciens complex]MCA2371565.1 flippase-like domain-containing protein [Agrobacterium tomkonis CIP 111-78]QCM03073.1 flippase-like domain-containing protein [Agrobacterium tumefaciens]